MKRLLEEAEKISGIKYDISSYGDIVDAIHVIQTEMGITGTTALEASETISGSLASMKASWENLMTALADDNADLGAYIQTFVTSAETALSNFMPRIGIALEGVVSLVGQLAPVVIGKIPELLSQLLPAIVEAATGLVDAVVTILPQLVQTLITSVLPQLIEGLIAIATSLAMALPQILQVLWSALSAQAPTLLSEVGNMIVGVAEFIQTNLPIIVEKAQTLMTSFGDKIRENLPSVISKGLDILLGLSQTIIQNIPALVATGMDMLKSIVQGIIAALPELIAKAPEIITNFANTISNSFQTIFFKGAEIIWEIIKGIISAIPDLIDNFPAVIEAIFSVWNAINWMNLGTNLMNGIKGGLKNAWGALKNTASQIFGDLKTAVTNPMNTAKTLIKGVIDAIKGFFSFKISWPKIPMPHFSVSPSGWKIGDLLKGSIPSLGISWYAKAMDNPIVMTKPTIWGYDPETGNLKGGGEAGTEVVSGADTLMNMIQTAVAAQNDTLAGYLDAIIDLLSAYFPEALEAMRTPATFDADIAARVLAVPMNRELGKITALKGRGR